MKADAEKAKNLVTVELRSEGDAPLYRLLEEILLDRARRAAAETNTVH